MLVDLGSGCVLEERHVYPLTVVSSSYHYTNPTKHVGLVQSGHGHYLVET